ncbi:hypothetical protein WKW79_17430 [Variovorax robiniae]|uniref:Uncharacterized protein n=1 Tax=Variovorax robiniae TaxID=1836199 RepID=A0ABU8X9I7_9BURK
MKPENEQIKPLDLIALAYLMDYTSDGGGDGYQRIVNYGYRVASMMVIAREPYVAAADDESAQ